MYNDASLSSPLPHPNTRSVSIKMEGVKTVSEAGHGEINISRFVISFPFVCAGHFSPACHRGRGPLRRRRRGRRSGKRPRLTKGPFTFNVCKNLGFWTPSLMSMSHSRNLSVLLSTFEPTSYPLSADVISEWPQMSIVFPLADRRRETCPQSLKSQCVKVECLTGRPAARRGGGVLRPPGRVRQLGVPPRRHVVRADAALRAGLGRRR